MKFKSGNLMVVNYIVNTLPNKVSDRLESLKHAVDYLEAEITVLNGIYNDSKIKKINKDKTKKKVKVKKRPIKPTTNPFFKKHTVTPELAKIVGDKPLTRQEIVTKIWNYIRKHNLQNPKNKRNVIADEALLPIFKKKEITMFELANLITRNMTPIVDKTKK